jgi:hypothetical protein
MTYRLDEMNRTDAVYQIAKQYPGGIEALASAMRKSAGVLYKKLEQHCETHALRQDEFEEIIARCAAARVPDAFLPLRALCFRFNHVAVKLPDLTDHSTSELAQMVVRVFHEGGDVARVVEEATKPTSASGRAISAKELTRIEVEIEQAIAALAELRGRVRTQAEQQQPALRVAK